MKKLLLSSLFLLFFFSSFSQVFINDVNINSLNTNYCIITKSIGFHPISVNYGQEKPFKKADISDKNGKSLDTKNSVDILNFMCDNGWDLVSFSKTENDKEIYIFKRK